MEYMKIRGQGEISDVNDTANNLMPVRITPAINTKLQISPEIFLKIQNGLVSIGILRGAGGNCFKKKA
jgi:hypothetical protein